MQQTRQALRAYLRDERGTITMEYVLWLPILLFWLTISAVFYDAYKSRDDAAKAAYTIADILSRQTELSVTSIEELADLQRTLVPRAASTMFLRLSSFTCTGRDTDGDGIFETGCLDPATGVSSDYEINWSILPPIDGWPDDFLDGATAPGVISSPAEIPIDSLPLMAVGDTIVLVDVSVPFQPIASWVGVDVQEWVFRVAVWPRLVADIDLTPDAVTKFVDGGGGYLGS